MTKTESQLFKNPFELPPRREPAKPTQVTKSRKRRAVDTDTAPAVQSGFSVFNPITAKENQMSKADAVKLDAAAREAAKAERQAAKEAKAAAKAEAQAAKAAERQAKAAAKAQAAEARAVERAAAKAEREARLAELGPQGKMSALRDAKKNYVKSATGQLRTQDDLADALDSVPPHNVIPLAISLLQLPENPYSRLNTGQQSMNLRNKLRGAIKRGQLTIADVIEARDEGNYALAPEELVRTRRAAKAEA